MNGVVRNHTFGFVVWICAILICYSIFVASSSVNNDKVKLMRPIAKGSIKQTKSAFTKEWEWPIKNIQDIRTTMSRYDCVVPVIGKNVSSAMAVKYSGGIYNGRNTTFIQKRAELFDVGFYPGVEYRLINIVNVTRGDNSILTGSEPIVANSFSQLFKVFNFNKAEKLGTIGNNVVVDQILTVRPTYKLIPELERQWPIEVLSSTVPYILTKGMYNTITVIVSASLALSFFLTAFLLSNIFTLSVINSRSMMPTILPRDIVVVEKVTPFFKRLARVQPIVDKNDIIFFSAPQSFNKYIEDNNKAYKNKPIRSNTVAGGANIQSAAGSDSLVDASGDFNAVSNTLQTTTLAVEVSDSKKKNTFNYNSYLKPVEKSSLLVKRVNSVSKGDIGTKGGASSSNNDISVCIDVRGDNPAVSLDSRQWGCLNADNIVGTPLFRVFPISRFGLLK